MQQQQQLVAQSQHQQQQQHSQQLQMQAAQQNGQLINNSQLAHQHQYQLSSNGQHGHQQQHQSPSKKERKSQSIMNSQLLQQSNQVPASMSSQGGASSAQASQPSPAVMPSSNNNSVQSQSAHHHQQNPFQGRGYSSFNSSVVGQGGTVGQSQINNQGGQSTSNTNATSHSNYFIQGSAAATAGAMMLNGNAGQSTQIQQQSANAQQQAQGQSQQSQYSGQKGATAVGQGQVLVQQPTSQLNHQGAYKQVVIANMGKTGTIPQMQMQQMNQLNSSLPSEFSQIMQNIVVPSMPQNHAIGVNSGAPHVVPISVSPMPMPPTNAVIMGNGPGHHQQATGTILNHHRRKQFRNMPAGNKLEQLQHHSLPQHHQQMVHHGGSFPQQNGIKQNGLRNSFILNNPGVPSGSASASNQAQQAQSEYFSMQQQTPQSQSTTMNSTAPNSANQGKLAGQPVYPIKSGKMRQQNEMTPVSSGVTQANFNPQMQQQYINNGQGNQRNATNSASMAASGADSSIYKIKSSQNIRLDDDIARDRALVHPAQQHGAPNGNEAQNQNIQNLQQLQMQLNAQSQVASEILSQQQQQMQIQHQQKMTQSNFYQQQQQAQAQPQQQQASNMPPSQMQQAQPSVNQQQQNRQGQLLQAQFQKHKQFNQTTTGNLNQMNNGNLSLNSATAQQQPAPAGQPAQVGTVRQGNKSYKRRFVNQGNQLSQGQNSATSQNQHGGNQVQAGPNNLQVPAQQPQTMQPSSLQVPQTQQTLINSQRAGPSRGGGGPSTYYDDNQSDTRPSQTEQWSTAAQHNLDRNKVRINISMNHTSQPDGSNNSNMNGQTGSSYQMNSNNFQQRIINPRDINFHNNGNGYSGNNAQDYGGLHKNHGVSPNKKSTFNVGGSSNNNTNNNNSNSNQVERINVTIPNPLLMPNASVQIQYQQELVRNVLQRVDDIFHLKQIVDLKNNKLKDKALASNDQDSTNVFDEVKNREIQRINKENSMLQRFKDARIEDKLLRKQFVKGCRKISVAFKGVVEEDEDLEKDLMNQKELLTSEVSCLEIMGEKLTKKQICAMTCKARLIEACLKEKEYDPYFSISLVLQGARNSFMREVGRHVDCYAECVESQNSSNQVRRIFKNMSETHHVRRVKLYKDSKIDKYFKLLITFNEESKKHIVQYKLKFQEAQIRQQNFENFINQEMQRRNRETREGSSLNRHDRDNSSGGGSRVRGSVNRDMTPNKMGKQLQMNSSLSSSDTNIVNIKNHATQNGSRNIKTPQSSGQNGSSGGGQTNNSAQPSSSKAEAALQQSGQKPTRLSLRMLSEKNKLKLQQQQQQQQQMNLQMQCANRNKGGIVSRKSQQLHDQGIVVNNTSRKSLKQLQQLKKSQQLNGQMDHLQGSSLTNGEDSTQTTNYNEFHNKARRTTSGGAFTYMGSHGQGKDCITPPLSIYAMYQADLFDLQHNRPRWFGHYLKYSRNFADQVRSLTHEKILELSEVQSSLNMDFILKYFWQLQDDLRQRKILTFVLIRNLLKIQCFWRAIKRMRNEAALKIQRTRRLLKKERNKLLEMEQKIDQLQYRCQLKKIQKWTKGQLKLIKSKRSKVNPAVEQVLRDPERVQNSKMIQEILIPIVLRIQRAIRYWIYRRKYLPYLRLKRQRDKICAVNNKIFRNMNKQYQPLVAHDCHKLHKFVGLRLHLRQMPNYFIDLQAQASKQLNGEDIKSIIKSRAICEAKLEKAKDAFKQDIIYESRMVSTQNIIQQFYS